jgi:hypothetical protein
LSLEDVSKFWSIVGALPYLTLTRTNLTYSVNKVCQYLHAPTPAHWKAVKQIVRYTKGIKKLGLRIERPQPVMVSGFRDADWIGCADDR